jgi:hypothetical protein
MAHEHDLRRKADLFRRTADHPTQGGRTADYLLLRLAERLDREADAAEGAAGKPTSPRSG